MLNLSQFPTSVDQFQTHSEIDQSQQANLETYQQLLQTANLTPAQQTQLANLTATLRDYLITADDINKIQDAITACQTFFLNNTSSYIDNLQTTFNAELAQFTYVGTWNSTTPYKQWNVVTYQNQSYLALLPNTNTPVTNTAYWSLIAAQGGIGPQGPAGADLSFVGVYNSASTYQQNQLVIYNGNTYVCLQNNTTNQVPTNSTYWSLFVSGSYPIASATAPSGAAINQLWIDTSGTVPIMRYFSGTSWIPLEMIAVATNSATSTNNYGSNPLPFQRSVWDSSTNSAVTKSSYFQYDASGTLNLYNENNQSIWNVDQAGVGIDSIYNVKSFGAKGDGVTDDTQAIQNAINAAGSNTTYFPLGTYIVSSTLSVDGAAHLIGAGIYSSIIKLANGANCDVIATPNDGVQREGVEIEHLCIDGNGVNQTGGDSLINMNAVGNILIHENRLINAYNHGIHVGSSSTQLAGVTCVLPRIYKNMIYGQSTSGIGVVSNTLGHGIFMEGRSSDGMVHGNDIGWFGQGAGVYLSQHNGSFVTNNNAWQCGEGYHFFLVNRLRISGCLSDYAIKNGFVVQECVQIHLTACQAKDSGQSGSGYDGFLLQGVSGNANTDITLVGCHAFASVNSGGLSILSYNTNVMVTCCDFAQASGKVYIGPTSNVNCYIYNTLGYDPQGFNMTTPAIPVSVGYADAVQNASGSPVRVYLTGQAGTHILDLNGNDKPLPGTNAPAWTANTAYSVNQTVSNGGNVYICTTAGTSATTGSGPAGTSASISDGSTVWNYLWAVGNEATEITIDSGCKIYFTKAIPTSWVWYGL